MGWFGSLDLGVKYAIVIAALIILVFTAGFMKLFYIRHKTRKIQAEAKAKAANEEGKLEQIVLNQREEGEGDLFGIRALERGFYGGVVQSRPTTPTPASVSSSTLVPSAAHIPFGQRSASNGNSSATSSIITIEVGGPKPKALVPAPLVRGPDVAVDMQLSVPDSPKHPRSPELPQFPRSPSPLSRGSPQVESDIPSSGLGLNGFSRTGPKIQNSPPGSPSSSGSQGGPRTNFSRPPSPPKPQIRIDAPRSDSPISTERVSTVSIGSVISDESNGNVEEGYRVHLGVDNGNNNNRVSSQSLAEVYDSYYDGKERESGV